MDGYLKEPPLIEIAQEADVEPEVAERALKRVQRFDPVGCAARTLQESLLVQAAALDIDDEVLVKMLTEHLTDLERRTSVASPRSCASISRKCTRARDIQRLDPRPGREYTTDRPQYITADVFIHKVGDRYFVQINDDGLPKLRISNYYLDTLKSKNQDKAAKDYVQGACARLAG